MSRKLFIFALILAAALVVADLIATSSRRISCTTLVRPSMSASAIAGAIASAADGSTICMASGSYPFIHVVGATHGSYVTLEPASGGTATVAGMEVQNSSFLRFRDLRMIEGFNMRDRSAYPGSHDYQFIDNVFEEPRYGIVLYGGAEPIRDVLIEGNYMHHVRMEHPELAGRCNAGYASGQDVTMYYAAGVTIAHNTFKQADVHYIQGGGAGPGGVAVEDNLFEGRVFYRCAHLNIWQIWDGGRNDIFRDNIVRAEPGQFASIIALIFENGTSGAACSTLPQTEPRNVVVENNLFGPRAAESYATELFELENLTFTHNTFVGHGQFGVWLDRNACGPTKNSKIDRNVVVGIEGKYGEPYSGSSNQRMVFGACTGSCQWNYNVTDDTTASLDGAEHYVDNWAPSWRTTSWSPPSEVMPPSGYYLPEGLPYEAGYQGGGGP